jgi:hypothetical protein
MKREGWIVYQLSEAGEKVTDLHALRRDLLSRGATEVFVPAYVSSSSRFTEIVYLYEGYLFARVPPDRHGALEESPYVQGMLTLPYTTGGQKQHYEPAFVPDSQVRQIKDQLRQIVPHFELGAPVRITRGTYSNIVGSVTVDPDLNIQDKVKAVLVDGVPRTCRAIGRASGLTSPQVNTPLQKLKKKGLAVKAGNQQWVWSGSPPEEVAVQFDFSTFTRIIRVPLLFLELVDPVET